MWSHFRWVCVDWGSCARNSYSSITLEQTVLQWMNGRLFSSVFSWRKTLSSFCSILDWNTSLSVINPGLLFPMRRRCEQLELLVYNKILTTTRWTGVSRSWDCEWLLLTWRQMQASAVSSPIAQGTCDSEHICIRRRSFSKVKPGVNCYAMSRNVSWKSGMTA